MTTATLRPSIDLATFAKFCAPGSFAAVAGVTREEAAAVLYRLASRTGAQIERYAVSSAVLAVALAARGLTLERWSVAPRGWRAEHSRSFARRMADELRDGDRELDERTARRMTAREWLAAQPDDVRTALEAAGVTHRDRVRARTLEALSVSGWLSRFPRGTWLLTVHGGDVGHVLAARDGAIVAGGEDGKYNDSPLVDAWRVVGGSTCPR
jgi:hypothetical protein